MSIVYENYEFKQIRTTRDTSGTNFNGEVIWDWTTGANRNHLWEESYLMCDLAISLNGASIDPALSLANVNQFGMSNNPMACLFTTGTYRVNDQVVSKINDIPQTSTMMRIAFHGEGQDRQSFSGAPINVGDVTDLQKSLKVTHAGLTTYDNAGSVFQATHNKNMRDVGLTGTNSTVRLSMKLPFFTQKSLTALPGNTKHQLSLQVNSLWQRLLMVLNTYTTSTVVSPTTVNLSITNLILWAAQFESVPVAPSSMYRLDYFDTFSTIRNLTNTSEQFQMTIPRNTNKLIILFFDNRNTDPTTPTLFRTVGSSTITRLRVSYDGQYFPNPDYTWTAGTAMIEGDSKRSYEDFVRTTESLRDTAGAVLSYGKWLNTPMFVFRVFRAGGSQANTVEVEMSFSGAPTNTSFYLAAIHDKQLEVRYNEQRIPEETNVYEL
jgi:hypothetical protein